MAYQVQLDGVNVYNSLFSVYTDNDVVIPSTKKIDKKEAIVEVRKLLETKTTNG